MQIRYIERSDINDEQWNRCIDGAVNGIVYAYTWYLDIVSPNWSALVTENYSYIFPLPALKRLGVETLSQPLFTQQLGLFSKSHITPEILKEFVESIPAKYKFISIHLNTLNRYNGVFHSVERVTYQLDLISTYSAIQLRYNQNTRRNNLKALAFGVSVTKNIEIATFLEFYRKNVAVKFANSSFNRVVQISDTLIKLGKAEVVGAYYQGILCAAALMVKSNGKLIYLFASSNHLGIKHRAMFAVVDQIIRWNAENHLVLDFEGSIIPSIARFYAGFGAKPCVYQSININRLPFYAKILFKLKVILKRFKSKI